MRTIRLNEPDTPESSLARIRQNERNIIQLQVCVRHDRQALGALVSPWKIGDVLVCIRGTSDFNGSYLHQRARVEEIWSIGAGTQVDTWDPGFSVFHRLRRLRKDGSEGLVLIRLTPLDARRWRKEGEDD